jgi:hypothetical protein
MQFTLDADGVAVQMHHVGDDRPTQPPVSATMQTKQQALAGTAASVLQWTHSRSASGSADTEHSRASLRGASSVAPYACVGDYAPAEALPGMRKGRVAPESFVGQVIRCVTMGVLDHHMHL